MTLRSGYKFTQLGELPDDWEVKTIEQCCEILDSQRVPLNEDERKIVKGNIPYYGANGVVDYVNKFIFDDKLILLAEDGGYFGEYAKRPIAYLVAGKCWVNNHAHVLKVRERDGLVTEYVFHDLEHKNVTPFIKGSTRSKLNQSELRQILIPIPPLGEQETIARILSTVDIAIAGTNQIIAKTHLLEKGLTQELLTKGIRHTKFRDTEIGRLPVDWKLVECEALCKEITVGIVVTPAKYYVESGIPCLRSFNILQNGIDYADLVYISHESNTLHEKSILHSGDVVTVRTGRPGISSVVPDSLEGANCIDLIILRPKEQVDPHFLSRFLNSDGAKRQIASLQAGSMQVHLNVGVAKKLKIPLPEKSEQQEIFLVLSSIEKKLREERQRIEKLNLLKRGLLQALLTGKVRVKVN